MTRRDSRDGAQQQLLIRRDELLANLDRATAGKVTIIAARAGSGKSSLLRDWASHRGPRHRFAMVQVQRDQRDARPFWLALLKAVGGLVGAPASAESAAATDVSGAAAVDWILEELAKNGDHVVLAIDDVHELASTGALTELKRLLPGLPASAHVILATRRDLPLHLHRLRLAGELTELRAADLCFSEQETRELLAASGVALSQTGVSLLHQRTEGWIAGLRLAAISLRTHPDPERFVAEFSGCSRTVAEYLIAEMLERQPEEVQSLLLRTSILEYVNGELADLLTGGLGTERILLDLEDADAFVASLDSERTWFRYHHLFADLLRLELRRRLPGEVNALHRRAADWFVRQGRIVEAVRHRQASEDWSEAAALLASHAFGMMLDGQEETVRELLQVFPQPSAAGDRPELRVVHATAEILYGRGDDAAAPRLPADDTCPDSAPADRGRRLRAAISAIELPLARRHGSSAQARATLEMLDDEPADSAELRNARATVCLSDGDPAAALRVLTPAADGAAPVLHRAILVEAHLLRALACRALDDEAGTIAALEHALALAEPKPVILPLAMTGANPLLAAAPRRRSAHAAPLAGVVRETVHDSPSTRAVRPPSTDRQLSPSELRVLRYLPTNLSRTEIADELSVSIHTINTHMRNIYAKLQASGRSTAVRRARELRLLAGAAR